MGKPPVAATLEWQGDLRFAASSAGAFLTLDGSSAAGPSPVQALAFSIASCMAMDVVDIIKKGRHPVQGVTVSFLGDRAQTTPHRFVRIALTFTIRGGVPGSAIERAIALSREKYCSVSNSLRQDIELLTSYEVLP